ncbi:terpene synthase family protein [Foetidibacter luteolus]|uniref:terpene synthase family protein n=1 Tax=Foetidibacter luteolus TaxID=2608880 RepID=UPI00129A9B2A|nr:terpene synthase family protein [Foetidibacter luteolus]
MHTHFLLPLPCYGFPSKISNWSDAVINDTKHWLETDFEFLPEKMRLKYLLSNFGKITARCLPCMKEYKQLQVAGRFMLWGTVFDDFFEYKTVAELEELYYRCMEILKGKKAYATDSPFFAILADIRESLSKLMPAFWLERFSKNVGIWIESMREEAPYKGEMIFPQLDYFTKLRERTIGVQAYLDLIEMQLDKPIPDEIMHSSYLTELYRKAARVFAWCNDFYSLLKDAGREPLNLILVLQHHYRLSLEEANKRAMEIHDADVASIYQMQLNVPDFSGYTETVRQFAYYIGVMIQGQNEWYLNDTMRYKKEGYPVKDSFKI